MNNPKTPCVFPSATEMELATLELGDGDHAMRVRVEPAPGSPGTGGEGYVRLEQLAWSTDLGWYCQKSFIIPGSLVRALITQLRKADCFLPKTKADADHHAPIPFRLHDGPPHTEAEDAQRRDA